MSSTREHDSSRSSNGASYPSNPTASASSDYGPYQYLATASSYPYPAYPSSSYPSPATASSAVDSGRTGYTAKPPAKDINVPEDFIPLVEIPLQTDLHAKTNGSYTSGSGSSGYGSSHKSSSSRHSRSRSRSRSPKKSSSSDHKDDHDSYESYIDDDYTRATMQGEDLLKPKPVEELFKDHTYGIDFSNYNDIPVDVTGNDVPRAISQFDDAPFDQIVVDNVRRAKYTIPTPVQKHAIPISLAGRDLMACAQTGSGKTAAFLLPIIHHLIHKPSTAPRGYKAYPSAVILAPTRELAMQIHQEALKFAYLSRLRCVCVYGGAPFGAQAREVERGVDIIVATPGRLIDFIERGKMSLSQVRYLVMDEADRMLDMGFEKQIRTIVQEREMPGTRQRVTSMFSATFPKEIRQLAADFLADYLFLTVGRVGSTTDAITQTIKFLGDFQKREEIMKDLRNEPGKTLVFAETKRDTDSLARYLFSQGFSATGIHGDRSQREREAALASFRVGRINILVATDVAARGLDISDVAQVINYDFPREIDSYVHRIGRTGRAGNKGRATSYFTETNKALAKDLVQILDENKQEVPSWLSQMAAQPIYKTRGRGRNTGGGGAMRHAGGTGYGTYSRNPYERPAASSTAYGYGYGGASSSSTRW